MAWVRYDDQFPINPKVTAVVAEDPGALSLHVLANTWSNTTKTPGYVPPHQPAVLLCDRALGPKWAEVLVRAGLWHERGKECEACRAEYAALANDEAKLSGWVFHNAKTYQAPARDRATPGTPADLSEKRRAAGRKGGQASAAKRAGQANQANSVSKSSTCSSKSVSPDPDPEPVLPTEAKTLAATAALPAPRDPASGPIKANDIVAAFIDASREAGLDEPTSGIRGKVARDAKRLLEKENVDGAKLLEAARLTGANGWQSIEVQLRRLSAERNTQGRAGPDLTRRPQPTGQPLSPADQRVLENQALYAKYAAQEGASA